MKGFVLDIFMILGSLALFIYGMKVMSDGIQKAAGEPLRNRLQSLAKNKTRGILTGLFTTSILQSSSATTVMVISFVNAGLITLYQSVPVIFGANIGTTITAWIVSIGGFVLRLQDLMLPLLVLAVPLFFRSKGKASYWGEFIIGFALLFMGLGFLQSSIPQLSSESEMITSLQRFTSMGIFSSFLFMFMGIIVTYILQSSSAAMTLTLTMVFNGWLPLELAAAMVLGENIGTTITAEIASLIGNIYAKRAARVHTLFNLIGALWMGFLIPFVLSTIEWAFGIVTEIDQPFSEPALLTLGLSAFHTLFNVLNACILIFFIPSLIRIAAFTWPSKKKKHKKSRLKNIGAQRTPELSLVELKNEIDHYAEMIEELIELTKDFLNSLDKSKRVNLKKRVDKIVNRSRKKEDRINQYIFKLREEELSIESNHKVHLYDTTTTNQGKVIKILKKTTDLIDQKHTQNNWFTPVQRNNLNSIFEQIEKSYSCLEMVLSDLNSEKVNLSVIQDNITSLTALCNEYRIDSQNAKKDYDYSEEGTIIYLQLVDNLESVNYQINQTSLDLGPSK